jgi:hypothetical protein
MREPPPPPSEAMDPAGRADDLAGVPVAALVDAIRDPDRPPKERRRNLLALRRRDDEAAQAAASLLCFELALDGDTLARSELRALRPAFESLLDHPGESFDDVLGPLAGTLDTVLADLHATLAVADPRDRRPALPPLSREATLDLVGDRDLPEDIPLDGILATTGQAERLRSRVCRYLGQDTGRGRVHRGKGLRTESGAELDALETFLADVSAYAGMVPAFRGLECLGSLFLAVNLRLSEGLGETNPRWNAAVRAGLSACDADLESMAAAGAVFAFEGERVRDGFEKVLELLVDFLALCGREGLDPLSAEAQDRYLTKPHRPPPVLSGDPRRRRR